jgi:hypothetical protein
MRTAREVFERHLESLRTLAREKDVHLADVLFTLVRGVPLSELSRLSGTPNERYAALVNLYQTQFYEWLADEYIKTAGELSRMPMLNDKKVSEAFKIAKQQNANLATGRPKGVKARQDTAKHNQQNLKKAIDDLFDSPEKRGWRMSNEEITSFLCRLFDDTYQRGTILQSVKREAARHRKAEKERQASEFLKR